MIRKNNKAALVFLCAAALLVAVLLSVPLLTLAQENLDWSGDEVAASYAYGTTLQIPDRTIGEGTRVSHSLLLPDGTSTYARSVRLNQCGQYTLTYTAKVGGRIYNESHRFSVDNMLYSVSDDASSVKYGTPDNVRDESLEGLIVSLAEGDTLSFNQAISVESFTRDTDFIKGLMLPSTVGSSDFSRLIITLTDMENPDVYLRIYLTERTVEDDTYGQTFVSAGGNGQDMVGIQARNGSTVAEKIFTNDSYGQTIQLPFRGKSTIVVPDKINGGYIRWIYETYNDDYPFALSFDTSTMEIWNTTNYMNPNGDKYYNIPAEERNRDIVTATTNNYEMIITDLDNPEYYRTLWSGFESGYVRLSVSAEKYNSSTANFCITGVAGMDLSKSTFTTEEKPVITVNCDAMPEAKVGHTYPIPEAEAFDLYDGEVEVVTNVWYNYTSDAKVSAKIDGDKFYTELPGYYAIVYTATNKLGMSTEKIIWVHASDDVKPVEISFEGKTESAGIGELVNYATPIISGGSGEVSVKVYAKLGNEIISTENAFRPEKMGTWQVVYEAVDFIGQKTVKTYDVTVGSNSLPVLVDEIVLPRVLISGGYVALPEIYANIYNGSTIDKALCDVTVIANGQSKTYKAGESFAFIASSTDQITTIKYSCNGTELYSEDIACVVPFTQSVLDYTAYFVGTNASAEKTEKGCVVSQESDGDFSFYYANPVIAHQLDILLRCVEGSSNYDELAVRLIDSADYDNVIEAAFKQIDGKVTLVVGDKSYALAYGFSSATFELALTYANESFGFANLEFPIEETVYGEVFEGFKSDKVYVEIEAKNATSSSVALATMRGYDFKTQESDVTKPYIVKYSEIKGGLIGEEYVIPVLGAADMISPSVNITMKVTAPDKSVVKDINGFELNNCDPTVEYTFKLDSFGTYKISYTIDEVNEFGVRKFQTVYAYSVTISDTIAPEIELTSKYQETYNVGDVMIYPDFTVSDNYSETDKLTVYKYITTPTGNIKSVGGNSIKASQAGVYKLHIVAIDELGNYAERVIEVKVGG